MAKTLSQMIAEATGAVEAAQKTGSSSPGVGGGPRVIPPPAPPQPVTPAVRVTEQGPMKGAAGGAQAAPVEQAATTPALPAATFKARATAAKEKAFAQLYVTLDFNGTAAYMKLFPRCSAAAAWSSASEWLRRPKVAAEVNRLLRSIETRVENGAEYVSRHLVSMAESNVFDYLVPVGKRKVGFQRMRFQTDKGRLTKEQQLNVRAMKLDPLGHVSEFKLSSRERAVDMLAKANRMYGLNSEQETMSSLAAHIAEAMERSAKLRGTTIDNDTGEIVDG